MLDHGPELGSYTLWRRHPKPKIIADRINAQDVVDHVATMDRDEVRDSIGVMWLPPEDEDGRVTGLGDIKYGVQVLDLVDSIRINGGE